MDLADGFLDESPGESGAAAQSLAILEHMFQPAVIQMATGTGKTRVLEEILLAASQRLNGNFAVVVPSLELLEQLDRVFNKHLEHGLMPPRFSVSSLGHSENAEASAKRHVLREGGKLVLFCEKSFNAFLLKRHYDLSDFSIVAFDEVHHINGASNHWLNQHYSSPGLILGLTATPDYSHGLRNRVIFRYTTEEAVAQGYLAPWDTHTVGLQERDLADFMRDILNGEGAHSDLRHPNGGLIRDHQAILYFSGKKTKGELDNYDKILNSSDIKARAFHSDLHDFERRKILSDFQKRKINVLLAIRTLQVGSDMPELDTVMVISERKGLPPSEGDAMDRLIQMRGRALRLDPNNKNKRALFLTTFPIPQNSILRNQLTTNDPIARSIDAGLRR